VCLRDDDFREPLQVPFIFAGIRADFNTCPAVHGLLLEKHPECDFTLQDNNRFPGRTLPNEHITQTRV